MSPKRPPEDVNPPTSGLSFPHSLLQYSISDIAVLVDEQVQDLSKLWRGTLMFEVVVVNHDGNPVLRELDIKLHHFCAHFNRFVQRFNCILWVFRSVATMRDDFHFQIGIKWIGHAI